MDFGQDDGLAHCFSVAVVAPGKECRVDLYGRGGTRKSSGGHLGGEKIDPF